MTREDDVYIQTLNACGSDIQPPVIQALLDHEHALADPDWWDRKQKEEKRRELTA